MLFGTTVQSSEQCADCLQANKNSLPGSTLVERRPYFRLLSLKNSSYIFAEIEFHLGAAATRRAPRRRGGGCPSPPAWRAAGP